MEKLFKTLIGLSVLCVTAVVSYRFGVDDGYIHYAKEADEADSANVKEAELEGEPIQPDADSKAVTEVPKPHGRRAEPLSEKDIEMIREYLESDFTYSAVAKKYGVDVRKFIYKVKKYRAMQANEEV